MQSEDTNLSPKEELSPEAERISRVLENCVSQVKIALSLPAIFEFYSESDDVDQNLSSILQAQQFLEENLEKLKGQKKKQSIVEDIKMSQLKIDIKNSVRSVLRYFRNHSHVLSDCREELTLGVGEKEFIKALDLFQDHLVENLFSGPNENPCDVRQNKIFSSTEILDLMTSQNQEVHETTRQLEEDLDRLKKEILRKSNEIEGFKKDLSSPIKEKETSPLQEKETSPLQEKETSPLQENETSPLQEKQDDPNELSSSSKLANLSTKVDQLTAQLYSLMLENLEKQRILREKNEDLEIETESLLQTFDKKMETLQAQLEGVEKENECIQEEMTKLQGPFSTLEVQCNQIQEKRQQAEDKRKEEIRVLELKSKSSVIIQAWWRGYTVRKALKNKSKHKGKKGKKGKKGSTKKKK